MNDMLFAFAKMLFSSIPEDEFEARLKSFGIEDRNIQRIREMFRENDKLPEKKPE